MKYTFLLPAYKGWFLDEMLRSIQAQTYRDFKVIISDDCSPEDLRSICEPYLSDPRFSYRRNAENMGSKSLVAHWNLLVSMCDTEFLILASDDDVYEPTFLEEIDKLVTNNTNTDIFRGRAKLIDSNSNILRIENGINNWLSQKQFSDILFSNELITCEANYCYRTSTMKKNGGYVVFPSAWFSDDATHIKLSQNGCAITQGVVFGYRSSDVSISNTWANEKDSENKTAATIGFAKWVNNYDFLISNKDCTNKIKRNIQNNIYHCSFPFFLQSIIRIPKGLNINKGRMVLHYLRIKLFP